MGGGVKNTDIFANSNYQVIVNQDHPIAKLVILFNTFMKKTYTSLENKLYLHLDQSIGYMRAVELFVQ